MNRFGTVRDAKEYLIRQILAQADRDGVSLSEVERKMMYFSETGWTLPDMMAVSREFDKEYDQNEYENKIGQLVRQIHDQPESIRDDDGWDEAVQRVQDEDHYLLVLIRGADSGSGKKPRGDMVRLILAGVAVVAVFLPLVFFIDSRVDDPTTSKWIDGSVFLGLAVLATLFANRAKRRSA